MITWDQLANLASMSEASRRDVMRRMTPAALAQIVSMSQQGLSGLGSFYTGVVSASQNARGLTAGAPSQGTDWAGILDVVGRTASTILTGVFGQSQQTPAAPVVQQAVASGGGIDSKTLLIIGGLIAAALVLT